mmetsp:Transcript_62498/g.149121  ORF Transcript_62498/g.149121 Transcript_62498/m.149121 type:complete len:98 (-) Transcript_62498:937-1230(-)
MTLCERPIVGGVTFSASRTGEWPPFSAAAAAWPRIRHDMMAMQIAKQLQLAAASTANGTPSKEAGSEARTRANTTGGSLPKNEGSCVTDEEDEELLP